MNPFVLAAALSAIKVDSDNDLKLDETLVTDVIFGLGLFRPIQNVLGRTFY